MPDLLISTLGRLSIERDGQPVTGLASRKAEALLVYLACNRRSHPREVLADLLWDGRTQSQALASLQDPRLMAQTIAGALEVKPVEGHSSLEASPGSAAGP
jgi:hypothetical protein